MFFGWKVVATALAVAAFAWSFGLYGPAVFLNTLHQQHGWSVSIISTAITVHYVRLVARGIRQLHRTLPACGRRSAAGGRDRPAWPQSGQLSRTKRLRRTPRPVSSTSTTSPCTRLGEVPSVPIQITSPGYRVR